MITIYSGDIGEGQREVEYEPLTAPSVPEPVHAPSREPVPAGACVEWRGYIDPDGYGRKRVGSKMERVHRLAWVEAHGPIPVGLVPDHRCRNRACANVDHLELVTRRVNTLRGEGPTAVNARKVECSNGHEFDHGNTYIRPDGNRDCRTCIRARVAAYKARKIGAAA